MQAAIGIDMGGSKLEGIVLDAAGAQLWRERIPAPQGDYAASVAAIVSLVRRAQIEAGVRHVTVGLGTPGTLTADGVMKNAPASAVLIKSLRIVISIPAVLIHIFL